MIFHWDDSVQNNLIIKKRISNITLNLYIENIRIPDDLPYMLQHQTRVQLSILSSKILFETLYFS